VHGGADALRPGGGHRGRGEPRLTETDPSARKIASDAAHSAEPRPAPAPPPDLAGFEILRHVKPERLESLADRGELRWLEPGEALLSAGERNSTLFLVLSGSFSVHVAGAGADPIAIVRSGESLGELSALDQKPVSADVIALEPCCVLAVPEQELFGLLETSHAFSINLLLKLVDRLRSTNLAIRESVQLREEAIERAAECDGLTGLQNRRWLDAVLPRWIERHARSGRPLSLALADLDHFKDVNDRHGHPTGDRALAGVAEALRSALRQTDRIARYGGEEFAILLPDTDLERGKATCERLCERVAETEVRGARGEALPRLTISIGVAQWSHGLDGAALIGAADSALYRAKRAGRNRCET
jgi:diguanylate cyclase (GGDEF)-like protein